MWQTQYNFIAGVKECRKNEEYIINKPMSKNRMSE